METRTIDGYTLRQWGACGEAEDAAWLFAGGDIPLTHEAFDLLIDEGHPVCEYVGFLVHSQARWDHLRGVLQREMQAEVLRGNIKQRLHNQAYVTTINAILANPYPTNVDGHVENLMVWMGLLIRTNDAADVNERDWDDEGRHWMFDCILRTIEAVEPEHTSVYRRDYDPYQDEVDDDEPEEE